MAGVTSIAEVEALVTRLYQPGDPATISQIEKDLQQLQRSPQAWQIADALLGSSDVNVRFFGALTFTVKLTSDPQSLDEDAANELLFRLIGWLVKLVSEGEKDLVTRKLCTTLVQFFLNGNVTWNHCARQLVCSFVKGEAILTSDLEHYPPTNQLIGGLAVPQVVTLLWFGSNLVEESKRTTYGASVLAKIEGRIEENTEEFVSIIHHAIQYAGPSSDRMHEEGMGCMVEWAYFVTRTKSEAEDVVRRKKLIQSLIVPAVHCMHADPENSSEGFADLLRKRGDMLFEAEHIQLIHNLITSPWGAQQMSSLLEGDPEADAFLTLLLAFCAAILDRLLASPDDWQNLLVLMHQILKVPGYPIEDESASVQALEFWGNVASEMSDPIDDEVVFSPVMKTHLLQAAEEYWQKIHIPPPEGLKQWDSDTVKAFASFRTDVMDFLGDTFRVCGEEILSGFVGIALNSIKERDWIKVEASLFCVKSMSEDAARRKLCQETLSQLLGSTLLTADVFAPGVPTKTRRTAVELLGRYADFFIKRQEFLVAPLNSLFSALTSPETAIPSAKAIALLCSACRKALVPELPNFLHAYQAFMDSPTADRYTKEKVINGICSILQAMPSDEERCQYIGLLLRHIEEDVRKSLEYMSQNMPIEAEQAACTALHCISAMGKALQSYESEKLGVIDLEEEEADVATVSFWNTQPAGIELQERIIKCIDMMAHVFGQFGEVNEAICTVFKSGFAERRPGPLVLPPHVFVSFVQRSTAETPRLTLILSTMCTFLNAYSSQLTTDASPVTQAARLLIEHVVGIMQSISDPATEPDVAHSCVEVLEQILRQNALILLGQPPQAAEFVFMFTIRCLQGPDVLPKRAAAHFWASFVTASNDASSPAKMPLDQVFEALGAILVKVLVFNIAGEAQRTSLEEVTLPLRRIITKHPRVSTWIDEALNAPDFPAPKVPEKERQWFKRMVIAARGGLNTKTVSMNFWQKCRDFQR
ncbi:Importin-beta [Lasiodiplodia theobromae]|uniref:Importin beta-like protein n=1 Tax=Lasiodiplodia theobromae TaxID=45133 RepID=A0A5N5DGK8_9PEZI|nr:Importin beta-like protein [Lasiodiplodia theobromae]KAF9631297.1 Importin-beta [Lasiodiplodia theobromae]